MSKLEELRKKLYEKEAPTTEEEASPKIFSPDVAPPTAWKEDMPRRVRWEATNPMKKYRKTILASFLIVLTLTLAGSLLFIFYQLRFGKSAVSIRIFGNEEAAAGSTEHWQVEVQNKSGVLLKDIELIFNFPEGSVPLSDDETVTRSGRARILFGELPTGEAIQTEFSARLFGKSADEKYARATVVYRRENLTSRLSEVAEFVTRISRIPLVISVLLPQEVSPDQEVDTEISISSDALSPFENLSIRAEYPDGFSFRRSDPAPREGDSLWTLASLKPGESFSIKISGTLVGDPADVKIFSAGAGEYNAETKEWRPLLVSLGETRITSPPLFVRTEINGSRKPVVRVGERLNVVVKYKNSSGETLRDVFVETRVSENLLDVKTLDVDDGVFDGTRRVIIWNPASVSELKELAPGSGGELAFSVAMRGTLPIIDSTSKNFIISVRSLIDTSIVPEAFAGKKLGFEDVLTAKVASRLSLDAGAFFFHPVIKNNGPLPPRVKQATEYAIVWKLSTLANDMQDVKVVGLLPGNVRWTNQVTGDFQDKLHFNPSSGEVIWEPGKIVAGTGVIRPAATIAFQVSVTPGEDVIRKAAELVKDIRFFGRDSFTDLRFEDDHREITTELSGDTQATKEQWYVIP
ncbi:MAG: hypothetical protein Q7R73_01840 [bacterium]|nr:hypothetical protein [bacterium]